MSEHKRLRLIEGVALVNSLLLVSVLVSIWVRTPAETIIDKMAKAASQLRSDINSNTSGIESVIKSIESRSGRVDETPARVQ